ncbi:hypothetical protein [Deinococcus planocerae]|uniref:hypothetical protein n=1 Tax=Deinococcus planocerae TaxID=1737569 RepID=UPI0011AEC951|nr:hypothetical protein [Deinococcus planocerae]
MLGIAGVVGIANASVQAQAEVTAVTETGALPSPSGYLWDVAKTMTNPVTRYVTNLSKMYTPVPFMGVLAKNTGASLTAPESSFD